MRDLTQHLAAAMVCPVTIVSGRDRTAVEVLVAIDGLGYIGSHGFDISGPAGSGLRHEVGAEHLSALDRAERLLRIRLAAVAGTSVERKRFGVAAHYRRALERRPEVEAAVRSVAAEEVFTGRRISLAPLSPRVGNSQKDYVDERRSRVGWMGLGSGAKGCLSAGRYGWHD